MGMFDNVRLPEPIPCPFCDRPLELFQSKDGACQLDTIGPQNVDSFYCICECGAWVEYRRKKPRPRDDWRDDFELDGHSRSNHAERFGNGKQKP